MSHNPRNLFFLLLMCCGCCSFCWCPCECCYCVCCCFCCCFVVVHAVVVLVHAGVVDPRNLPLTLYVPGGEGADLPTLMQTPNFLKIPLCKPMSRFVDFSCMSTTVLLQKSRASYVPRFNFSGPFFDKKFGFQIANFLKKLIFAKNNKFSKKISGPQFSSRGMYF